MILLLKFKIGDEYYALNTDNVIEIIPVVSLRKIPGTVNFFAGIFDYRGIIVPVIDITQLTLGQPATIRLSTRIILTNFTRKDGQKSILGLIAEDMTDTLDIEESALQNTGILSEKVPFLGPIIQMDDQFIQCIELNKILSDDLQKIFFLNLNSQSNHNTHG